MSRSIHFGVFLLGTGNHTAGWRYPGADQTFLDIKVLRRVAAIAERGLFDFLFMGDGLAANLRNHPPYTCRLEPMTMLSALSMTTTHVGLAATMSTTYSDPYTVARVFASLDHISGGRAAWNAVTTAASASGGNFGRVHPDHEQRYEIAEEFINVVRGLWDCWSDQAIIADRATGRFFDESEVKPLNHQGPRFSVKGPINMGRCPQGQPLVLQAGGSERGLNLAARTADVVFSVVQDFEEARTAYAGLKERVRRFGRDPDSVTILPGVMPIIGKTDSAARDALNTLQGYVDSKEGLAMLSSRLGTDISKYPLDGPIPDLPAPDTSHGFARALLAKGKRDNLSLRDLYNLTAAARGHWVLCGSVQTIADTLEKWFLEGAADGFNVMPAYFPGAFDDFVDLVVPELQRRGLHRKAYTGTTLRDHLGLSRPAIGEYSRLMQQSKAAAS
ncbi:LLM class flavin-dependent oxidoreductase [Rhodoplanes sp. Z2-YC6860]|uniref:LLM class flavin-dependent oxidoreductase n=1 Tax=Rhodoplanes sp. Z2-YC6860 TaxID=674703 RepID=UPI000835505A|nr:LLM class flavin-dependent oxidoreductase [Rhodoplanes sp. Z2-YC6860]